MALIARLPRRETRAGVPVTPYLASVPADVTLRPDPAELDAVFRVPIAYLLDQRHLTSDHFEVGSEVQELPCYRYGAYRIWGFTLNVLVHFLNVGLNAGLSFTYLHHRLPPEQRAHLIELEEEYSP